MKGEPLLLLARLVNQVGDDGRDDKAGKGENDA